MLSVGVKTALISTNAAFGNLAQKNLDCHWKPQIANWLGNMAIPWCGLQQMSQDQSKDEAVGSTDNISTFKKPGDLIARQYEVIEVLGEGGASVVYRAKHAVLGTECAIKVLLPDRIPDQRVIQRFQIEAKSIGRLEHRNIVAVHEFGIDDDNQPYLVMDYVAGKNLAQLIDEDGFLTPRRALSLFIQIAEALMHAHSRSVIHRDLKPKNVIVEHPGKDTELARLVDFGIAKITETESENKSVTQTGEVFGSPLFMSPEQCKGLPLDQRSDIYSLGCLMYETITGNAAAGSESVVETLMLHVNGLNLDFDNAPPAVILKEKAQKKSGKEFLEFKCFNGLRKAIETCTATTPEKRYRSAAELLIDLRAIEKNRTPLGLRARPLKLNGKSIALPSWSKEKSYIAAAIGMCLLTTSKITEVLNQGGATKKDSAQVTEIDARFAEIVDDLASSKKRKRHRYRLPVERIENILTRRVLKDTPPSVEAAVMDFMGGPHGAFNTIGNDNMTIIASDCELKQLKDMEQLGCTDYAFSNLTVSDACMFKLSKLKKLDWLSLSCSNGFSKHGLAAFKHSSLKKLHLSRTAVDDSWAPMLASLPLSTLNVQNCKVTDKGKAILASSKTLKFLLVDKVSDQQTIAALKSGNWRLLPEEGRQSNLWYTRQ